MDNVDNRCLEAIMKGKPETSEPLASGGLDSAAAPPVGDRTTWQAQLDALLVREKAHTREGDAIAAIRRRLPMVEVDATTPLIGRGGPLTLLDAFVGRHPLF